MILVTGYTGNTGKYVIQMLKERYPGKRLIGISRKSRDVEGVTNCYVELEFEHEVESIFTRYSFDVVIHIAQIVYTPLMIRLAIKYKVPHVVLVHTTGIYSKYRHVGNEYRAVEQLVKDTDFQETTYTIVRPTMIYGDNDKNIRKLIRIIKRSPIIPVIGNGKCKIQPVHSEDLAKCIVNCLDNPNAINKGYTVSGGTVMEYKEMLEIIAKTMRKNVFFVHIPIRFTLFLVTILNKFTDKIIKIEQVERMQEDRNYPHDEAYAELNYRPSDFKDRMIKETIRVIKAK